jgi:hypothetical protein
VTRRRRWRAGLLVLAAGLALAGGTARGQTGEFGKNKIQYTEFEWRVLESEHFDLYFYPEEDTLARTAVTIAENAYDELSSRFRHEVTRRIPLIIYSSHHDFEQTNISPYFLPEGVAGFTEFLKGRVALPFNGSYFDFEHVIRHELVHVFQLSKLSEVYRLHFRNSFVGPPLWFTEGMAEVWSGDWDATGDLFLGDMVLNDALPPISGLWRYSGTFVIYKIGQDLVQFLEKHYGTDVVPALYDELWRVNSFEEAMERVTETPIEELSERWHHELTRRYYPRVQDHAPIALSAKPMAVKGGANFQPTVPPPGSPLPDDTYLFVSPRTGYTNIYRGSTEGREKDVHAVVRGQRQAEFESFHGFDSRIAVSKDGMLAFVSKFHERDGLFIYDLVHDRLVDKWQFEGLISLRSPTFHPDGARVAFAGLSQDGQQDIYVFDLRSQTLRPLTRDRYLDDDPDWSPDGRTLAFVSDRTPWGDTGGRNIFLLDMESGALTALTLGPWKDGTPSWDATGRRLAYSSDRAGTPQIFVADSTHASTRITSLLGGAMNPEWLPGGDELLFTGMSTLRFGIYRAPVEAKGDSLPPPVFRSPMLAGGNADSLGIGPQPLRPAWKWTSASDSVIARERPYRSHFTLDFAQGGVALEPVQGTGEGLQALLSDQLGNQLFLFQLSNTATSFDDFLGRFNIGASYFNLEHRINYGGSVFHFAGDFLDERGFRYFERRVGAAATIAYPFSRYARVESSMGLLYSDRESDSFRPARQAALATNYISYIYDNSLWLPTGPIDGFRWRVTLGLNTSLDKVEVENVSGVVDVRRYFRTGLRTAYAVRLQGRLSEGSLPQRFVLGGSWSFRGYPRRSLVGTRSVLLNQEWRFPLLEGVALGLPVGTVVLPPVQGALFLDAAQAWEEDEVPDTVEGSFGLGFRMSLGGFLVLRLDLARQTDFRSIDRDTKVDFFVGYNY